MCAGSHKNALMFEYLSQVGESVRGRRCGLVGGYLSLRVGLEVSTACDILH